MDSENSIPQQPRKRRLVSRKTITFCEQRSIYIALLHLQDAIEEGDAMKAEELRRDIMKELPIGEDAIEQSHSIYQLEKQQREIKAGKHHRTFDDLSKAEQIVELASLWN
jgi:hypothetical protein